MKEYDCVVVGAGPAGGMAAWTMAKKGASVLILEKKKEIGVPVQCGEGISADALSIVEGFNTKMPFIKREVKGAQLFLPGGWTMVFKRKGYLIKREKFDQFLVRKAVCQGAELHLQERVNEIYQNKKYHIKTDKEIYTSHFVIIASGANFSIKGIPQKIIKKTAAVEYKFIAKEKPCPFLKFFHGEMFHPFYGWFFHRGDTVAIGMGIKNSSSVPLFHKFCVLHGYKPRDRISIHSGVLPWEVPKSPFVIGGVLWTGDAAGLIHPMTAGGIHGALISGKWAAETITKGNLKEYDRKIRSLTITTPSLWLAKERLFRFSNYEWDSIGKLMHQREYNKIPILKTGTFLLRDLEKFNTLNKALYLLRKFSRSEYYSW